MNNTLPEEFKETEKRVSLSGLEKPNTEFFCSLKDDGRRESKIQIYNAVNSPQEELSEHIGETLYITDVVAYPVELEDEETGEVITAVRIILIDVSGIGYSATSEGVYNSLTRIFSIVGTPSWADEPLLIKAKQVKTRNGNNKVTVLELVEEKPKTKVKK